VVKSKVASLVLAGALSLVAIACSDDGRNADGGEDAGRGADASGDANGSDDAESTGP
jgi:hypothetical protein